MIKIMLLSDTHLRTLRPRGRVDDFWFSQHQKLCALGDIYEQEGCEVVLQAGDLFDSPNPSNYLKSTVIRVLRGFGMEFCTVFGQHDITFHSLETASRSATGVLEAAGVAKVLGETPQVYKGKNDEERDIKVYGASFGEKPPRVERSEDCWKILVAHVSVGDRPLFPGHQLTLPNQYYRLVKNYDLVLLGDYHYPFEFRQGDTTIVNIGCMLRLRNTEDDRALNPQVGILTVDGDRLSLYYLKLPYLPSDEVFGDKESVMERSEGVLRFVDALAKGQGAGSSFRENLVRCMNESDASKEVREILTEALELVEENKDE